MVKDVRILFGHGLQLPSPFAIGRRQFLAASAALTFGGEALAQTGEEVVLIINGRNPTQSLPKAELIKLFLGQTSFWHGVVPVRLFVRPDSSKAAQALYEPILGMTPQSFRKHWDEVQLAGKGVSPKSYDSVESLALEISRSPGAIGFGLTSEAWQMNGVKVIAAK
jgi:ABC-type phosphate transport system substrate-binding protein